MRPADHPGGRHGGSGHGRSHRRSILRGPVGHGGGGHRLLHWRDRRDAILRLLAAVVAVALIGVSCLATIGWARQHLGHDTVVGSANPNTAFSAIALGYEGAPVVASVSGPRTRAVDGVCMALVRDASSSVAESIDPSGQVSLEMATVADALGVGGVAGDLVAGVAFADTNRGSDLLDPSDPAVASTLKTTAAVLGGGTNITGGLTAAMAALVSCPAGRERHVVIVTDGDSSQADVAAGLAALRSNMALDIVVLDVGGWSSLAALWSRPGANVHRLNHLDAGAVAHALADILTDATGQTVSTGFASTP